MKHIEMDGRDIPVFKHKPNLEKILRFERNQERELRKIENTGKVQYQQADLKEQMEKLQTQIENKLKS